MRRHTDPPWLSGRPSSNGPRWLIAPRAGGKCSPWPPALDGAGKGSSPESARVRSIGDSPQQHPRRGGAQRGWLRGPRIARGKAGEPTSRRCGSGSSPGRSPLESDCVDGVRRSKRHSQVRSPRTCRCPYVSAGSSPCRKMRARPHSHHHRSEAILIRTHPNHVDEESSLAYSAESRLSETDCRAPPVGASCEPRAHYKLD